MASSSLSAQKRGDLSNSATKELRRMGNVPGVFYRKDSGSIPISVKNTALNPFVYTSEVKIINLNIEGTDTPYNCILKEIQFDPVSDKPIHFDLLGISAHEKIKIEVPLVLAGTPAGVKDGGIVQHTLHSIEIECLPENIPPQIEVNIESLMIGDSVQIKDIPVKNFEILDSPESTIVSILPPAVEEVAAPVAAEGEAEEQTAEPEVIAKGKKEEETEEEKK
ncbi:MAG TPA: 50S ribosomal protein L25 [Ignavibacteria bacterium]|jgi:large subunit ribosomal protein L25